MREFFKGWKRKAGVMTLVVACVLMAGWARSQSALDWIELSTSSDRHLLTSSDGVLVCEMALDSGVSWPSVNHSYPMEEYQFFIEFYEVLTTRWYLRCSRFGAGYMEYSHGTGTPLQAKMVVFAPYWSIVLPLTVLSAYLILSRQPRTKITSESPKDQP